MAILFFLIHFFFVITFFVLGRTIEVIVFSLLAVFSLFFFNSLFVPREREEKQDKKSRSSRSFFVFMTFFKKGVYVFSTALFYLSLYGIAYGLNHIYSHFTLATSFWLLTLILSSMISWVFFAKIRENNETISLIFRSNFVIYSLFYLVLFFVTPRSLEPLFIINSLVSFFWLISILVLDKRLTGLQRSFLFVLFIAYLFSFLFTYGQIAISDVMVLVFLEGIVIGLFSFETIPHIAALREVHDLSRALSFFLVALITLIMPLVGYGRFSEPIIILLEAINGCLLFFMYRRWNNRIALVFWLSTLLFLYARTLFWPFSSSVFLYFSFTFILPYFLLAFPLFSSWIQQAVEKFIFIGFALVFATAYTGYYFVVFRGSFDILAFSTALLCGSILLFLAFISLRSKSSNRSAHLFH